MLTADRARELLSYDRQTGLLTWRVSRGRLAKAGDAAGAPHHSGYIHVKVDGKYYLAHRLAWLIETGEWPQEQIDHDNRSRSDNRWDNLREATQSQNQANKGAAAANTSGFKGVTYSKRDGCWYARIKHQGRSQHIGLYDTAEEAAEAYRKKAAELHGEFACLS